MPITVKVLLWGESHRDPASCALLAELASILKNKNLPFVFCEESRAGDVLGKVIMGDKQFIEIAEQYITIPAIQKLAQQSPLLSRRYYLASDGPRIIEALNKEYPSMHPSILNVISTAILRYNGISESLKLHTLLDRLKIPFKTIDPEKESESAWCSRADYLANENKRVSFMSGEIIQETLAQANNQVNKHDSTIVIIAKTGMNHVHRLAAHLWQEKADLSLKGIELHLMPLILFSPYSMDYFEQYEELLEATRENDSAAILNAYNHVRVQQIFCREDLKNKKFVSDEIATIFKKVTSTPPKNQHVFNGLNFFTNHELAALASVSKGLNQATKAELLRRKSFC